jgi:hypothetical protein
MWKSKRRIAALVALSSGTLLASTCDLVAETIRLAFGIVDVWV